MNTPQAVPQNYEDLDKLTRLEMQIRKARSERRWRRPSWATVCMCVFYGVIAWISGRSPSAETALINFFLILTIVFSVAGDQQQETEERLQEIEKHLGELTEELARRSRDQSF